LKKLPFCLSVCLSEDYQKSEYHWLGFGSNVLSN
jgi:hypothetical protein